MKTHSIPGGGGLTLHVEETGPVNAQSILFIHGFSQCGLAWRKQMHSGLADEFRLIAMDIRGHGSSEKPRDAYGDSHLWAEDVHAVVTALGLHAPVLVGWSYGGVIVLDYVKEYGDDRVGGIQLVGSVTRLGEPLVSGNFLGGEFLALMPGFFSENTMESVSALTRFLRLCHGAPLSADDLYLLLGANVTVPPYVRQGLFARSLNHDQVLAAIRRPVILVHGEADEIVSPRMCTHMETLLSGATVSTHAKAGHMPFWTEPERYNRELGEFARVCASGLKHVAGARLG
jgi:pimeloyl-ACP methyl ester carboxylesterase